MSERIDYSKVAPAGIRTLGGVYDYIAHCGLPEVLVDLVYLRVSQINGCAFCIDMHSRDLLARGVRIEKILLLQAWHEAAELFDSRERAALAWAETVTCVSDSGLGDAAYDAAIKSFSEKELVDLTIAIGIMNAYNRMVIGFRSVPQALKSA